jgi:hypothetical protein
LGAAALGEPVTSAMLAARARSSRAWRSSTGAGRASGRAAAVPGRGARRRGRRSSRSGSPAPSSPAAGRSTARTPAEGGAYDGRPGQLDAAPPRVDGPDADTGGRRPRRTLCGPRGGAAHRFSRFQPSDGAPATDLTEVLVWYSPTAIHFGVRAFAPAGTVNATLADRDRIGGDDHVTVLLSTFDDARQAVAFAVNPLGIQMDGTLVETGNLSTGGLMNNGGAQARENVDLSADFVYQSKGRVTAEGYEVEIRVPFKSLRYQPRDVQRWGINVLRRVTRLGAEDSWAPARRGWRRSSGRAAG